MDKALERAGSLENNVGRMGYILGMQLTKQPAHMPDDRTTIELGMEYVPNTTIVHEQDIAVRDSGAGLLTRHAPVKF